MQKTAVKANQIWQDDCYYLDRDTGECKRKYVLILAVENNSSDAITAVFTSKANGLTETPPCSLGPPRAGYYVGVLGGILMLPTWVDFSSIDTLDNYDLASHIKSGRKTVSAQALPTNIFCAVLRCAIRSEDIENRQLRWIKDTAELFDCP